MSDNDDVSLSPRRKKIKNNEIFSSLSSSEDINPARLFSPPAAGSKRKYTSSTDDDEWVQSSKLLKVVPFQVVEDDIFEEHPQEEPTTTTSDKENAEEFIEPVLVERIDKVQYVVPEHYHTEEEYQRDDMKAQARLRKLLKAIDRSKTKKTPESSPEKVSSISQPSTVPNSTVASSGEIKSTPSTSESLNNQTPETPSSAPQVVTQHQHTESATPLSSASQLPVINLGQLSTPNLTPPQSAPPAAPTPLSAPQVSLPQIPTTFNFNSPVPVPQFNSLPAPDGQPALFSLGAGNLKKQSSAARRRPRNR